MKEQADFDRQYFLQESSILSRRVNDHFAQIILTERLCVAASGTIAAFVVTNLMQARAEARITLAVLPVTIMLLGWLRSIWIGYLIVDVFNYMERVEKSMLSDSSIGYHRDWNRRDFFASSPFKHNATLFWAIGFSAAIGFLVLVRLGWV